MNEGSYSAGFAVAADHPALPGHFPGHPVVPGVMLLEQVADALRRWRNERITRFHEAKFVAPLGPGQAAELTLRAAEGRIRFEIRSQGNLLARGQFEGTAA